MESDSAIAIPNSDVKNTTLVGMFTIIPLPMMRSESYVLHDLLKF